MKIRIKSKVRAYARANVSVAAAVALAGSVLIGPREQVEPHHIAFDVGVVLKHIPTEEGPGEVGKGELGMERERWTVDSLKIEVGGGRQQHLESQLSV